MSQCLLGVGTMSMLTFLLIGLFAKHSEESDKLISFYLWEHLCPGIQLSVIPVRHRKEA